MAGRWGMAIYVYERTGSGTFEIRYPIPAELQELFPKAKGKGNLSHWILSLGTKDRERANQSAQDLTMVFRGYADWLSDENHTDFERILWKWFNATKAQLKAIRSNRKKGEALADQLASEGLSREEAFKLTLRMTGFKDIGSDTTDLPVLPSTSEIMSMIGDLRDPGNPAFVGHSYDFLVELLNDVGLRPPALSGRYHGLLAMLHGCGETLRNLLEFELALRTGREADFQPDVEYLRSTVSPLDSPTPAPRQGLKPAQIATDATPTLGEFFANYEATITAVTRPVEAKTVDKRRSAWSAFASWLGESRTLGSISKSDMWDFHEALADAPRSAGVRADLKEKTFREAVALARSNPDRFPRRSQQTIQSELSQVRTVLEFAVSRGIIPSNPANNVTATRGEPSDGVRAFTIDELNKLFALPVFTETPQSIRDDEFWVPLLQLYTGCRLSELAMPLSDFVTAGQVPHFRIAYNEDRRIKNDGSRRIIPMHPELKRIGFLDYVQSMRDRNETKLFPMWTKPRRGNGYGRFSDSTRRRKFNAKMLNQAGINGADVSARSFRKNFEQLITEGGVPDRIALRLQGRKMNTSADYYLPKELSPQRLEEYLSKCSYVGLELDHLTAGDAAF